VFSTRSVQRCYKQDYIVARVSERLVGEWELVKTAAGIQLLLEAGSSGKGQFRNPQEGEHPPSETDTKQRLVNIVIGWEVLVCPIVVCETY
jgi:hypothetical protein